MHRIEVSMLSTHSVAVVALFALAASGCEGLPEGAKGEFVRQFSCPDSRVEVRAREDIRSYALVFGAQSPPAEVKADPERLAVWQKHEDDQAEGWNANSKVFEARGCGHEVLYTCSYTNRKAGSNRPIACSSNAYPAGVTRW